MPYIRPDYDTAREQAGFHWSVGSGQGALREVTGTPIREFNLEPAVCIDCYRKGRPILAEMFGEDVGKPGLSTPAVSYGHVNCLGSELLFPEGGELAHTHIYGSLEEGIEALKKPVDWANEGMAKFYLEFRETMMEAFPGESVGYSFGLEGPLTTAYELRGQDLYMDLMDKPEVAKEFLRLTVDSTLDFHNWMSRDIRGVEPINPSGGGMCDDCASFVPPRLFGELVLPYWDQYFSGMTTGKRSAHVEDLRIEQLPFLEEIGLSSFDPSISPYLNPQLIAKHCRVPFAWRMGNFHYRYMSERDLEDWVFQSCADGASGVTTNVAETMCDEKGIAKVRAFIRAGKEAKKLVEDGCSREEIGQRVSPAGREKLWAHWPGYKGKA